jgi:hypothetical protein
MFYNSLRNIWGPTLSGLEGRLSGQLMSNLILTPTQPTLLRHLVGVSSESFTHRCTIWSQQPLKKFPMLFTIIRTSRRPKTLLSTTTYEPLTTHIVIPALLPSFQDDRLMNILQQHYFCCTCIKSIFHKLNYKFNHITRGTRGPKKKL